MRNSTFLHICAVSIAIFTIFFTQNQLHFFFNLGAGFLATLAGMICNTIEESLEKTHAKLVKEFHEKVLDTIKELK